MYGLPWITILVTREELRHIIDFASDMWKSPDSWINKAYIVLYIYNMNSHSLGGANMFCNVCNTENLTPWEITLSNARMGKSYYKSALNCFVRPVRSH